MPYRKSRWTSDSHRKEDDDDDDDIDRSLMPALLMSGSISDLQISDFGVNLSFSLSPPD